MRILIGLILTCATGCGGGGSGTQLTDMGGAEGTQIATLVEDLNDAVGNAKKFDGLFVKGAKPADGKKYAGRSYFVSGKPAVSGATATCKIRIDGANGQTQGEPEWGFEKDGDKWKIKSAPLP